MKYVFSVFVVICVACCAVHANDGTAPKDSMGKLGLVDKLVVMKVTSENTFIHKYSKLVAEREGIKEGADSIRQNYDSTVALLRAYSDIQSKTNGMLFQLAAILYLKQKPLAYKKLDKYVRGEGRIKNPQLLAIVERLNEVSDSSAKFNFQSNVKNKSGFAPFGLIPSVKDMFDMVSGVVTSVKEGQKNRADSLATLLKGVAAEVAEGVGDDRQVGRDPRA